MEKQEEMLSAWSSLVLAGALQMLQAKCEHEVCADAIGQEQPFVVFRPMVWPQEEQTRCVQKEDCTHEHKDSRLTRRDQFL